MDQKDRVYYAQRAAEELDLALAAGDPKPPRPTANCSAYLERASVGDRPVMATESVG